MLKYKYITISLLIIILFTIINSGCINDEEETNKITAIEGREEADKIAKNWNERVKLSGVRKSGKIGDDGLSNVWYYTYYTHSNQNTSLNILSIKITGDGMNNARVYSDWSSEGVPITNWTIDSDEAYEIAENNDKISKYLSKYDDAEVDSFHLSGGENNSSPEWWIYWMATDWGSPVNARIVINAQTGEVIEVESDI